MFRCAILLAICAITSACTIVEVHGANPSTSVHFGILKLEPAAGSRSVSFRIRGIGIVPGFNGTTLGFAREEAVMAFHPEDCRVVLFDPPRGRSDQQQLGALLSDPNLCRPGERE